MVRNIILSHFQGTPPKPGQSRKIKGGPLYSKEDLLALLAGSEGSRIIAWTRRIQEDLQRLDLNESELVELVSLAVRTGTYLGSEWCERSPGGPWSACDAYQFNYKEWFPVANKHESCKYYLKLALGKSGVHLLLISCHPS